jgi:hypothetical protein
MLGPKAIRRSATLSCRTDIADQEPGAKIWTNLGVDKRTHSRIDIALAVNSLRREMRSPVRQCISYQGRA